LKNHALGFGKTMVVLSCVVVGSSGAGANATIIAAEGQTAITNIMPLIGAEKKTRMPRH
jgi:hypothetical protein